MLGVVTEEQDGRCYVRRASGRYLRMQRKVCVSSGPEYYLDRHQRETWQPAPHDVAGALFRHIYELESEPADVRHAIRQNDCNLRVARVDVGVKPSDDFKEQLLQVIAFTRVRRLDFL